MSAAAILLAVVAPVGAALAGAAIGAGFGLLQTQAQRRHQLRVARGDYTTPWASMGGSSGRVVSLLLALAAVQVLCPALFAPGSRIPWFISGGMAIGYGWTLVGRLRRRGA